MNRLYLPDGEPAAAARVTVFNAGDTSRMPVDQVIADANGDLEFGDLPDGWYAVVARQDSLTAFQDSLFSGASGIHFLSDTLEPAGSLSGVVRVQKMHSPRIVTVHVEGTDLWSNVDSLGAYRIAGIAGARYTVRMSTRTEDYTDTYLRIRGQAGISTVADTLEMIFTGTKPVSGLQAEYDREASTVRLTWEKDSDARVSGYRVYRCEKGEATPGRRLAEVEDTRFTDDSLFKPINEKYPWDLDKEGRWEYRVSAVLKDGQEGPMWEVATVHAQQRLLWAPSTLTWERLGDAPFPVEPAPLVEYDKDRFRLDTLAGRLYLQQASGDLWVLDAGQTGWSKVPRGDPATGWLVPWKGKWYAMSGQAALSSTDLAAWDTSDVGLAGEMYANNRGLWVYHFTIVSMSGTPMAPGLMEWRMTGDGEAWRQVGPWQFRVEANLPADSVGPYRSYIPTYYRNRHVSGGRFDWSLQFTFNGDFLSKGFPGTTWGSQLVSLPPQTHTAVDLRDTLYLFPTGDSTSRYPNQAYGWAEGSLPWREAWPGKGDHAECVFDDAIYSVSRSGVYRGSLKRAP